MSNLFSQLDPELIKKVEGLGKAGVISNLHIMYDAPLNQYKAWYNHTGKGSYKTFQLSGSHGLSADTDINKAVAVATYELLERDSLLNWNDQKHQTAKLGEHMNGEAFKLVSNPEEWGNELDLGPAKEIPEDQLFHWHPATEITTQKSDFVPAQLLYINYHQAKKEPIIRCLSTNGTAVYSDKETAQLKAIYELLERDAFLYHWLTKTPPKRVPASLLGDDICAEIEQIEFCSIFKVHFLQLETVLKESAYCCVLQSKEGVMGIGTALVPHSSKEALESAFHEARVNAQGSPMDPEKIKYAYEKYAKHKRILHMSNRKMLWLNPEMHEHLKWFLHDGSEASKLPEARKADRLSWLQKQLRALNYTCYVSEIGTPLTESFGLHVYKAIMPDIQELYFNESFARLGSRRIDAKNINPIPHPYL